MVAAPAETKWKRKRSAFKSVSEAWQTSSLSRERFFALPYVCCAFAVSVTTDHTPTNTTTTHTKKRLLTRGESIIYFINNST